MKLVHFTLASEDVERARSFYTAVFGSEFTAVELGDETLYRGQLAGLGMVICPSSMAGVDSNRSRHQLQFEVDDVAGMLERVTGGGGTIHTPLSESGSRSYAVICDPDNNTIELVGAIEED